MTGGDQRTNLSQFPIVRWIALYVIIAFFVLIFFDERLPQIARKALAISFGIGFFGIPVFALYLRRKMTPAAREAMQSAPAGRHLIRLIWIVTFATAIVGLGIYFAEPNALTFGN